MFFVFAPTEQGIFEKQIKNFVAWANLIACVLVRLLLRPNAHLFLTAERVRIVTVTVTQIEATVADNMMFTRQMSTFTG